MKSLFAAGVLALGWWAFDLASGDPRSPRMEHSPQWRDGRFRNPQPMWNDTWGALMAIRKRDPNSRPTGPVPAVQPTRAGLEAPPASGLRATWLGHSTVYLEVDGVRILTDPMWSDRASPVSWAGPRRFYAPLISLEDLPRPQVVAISHNHYDHLDEGTLSRMKDWDARFIVPLGVGARLVRWGIPVARITELDWWQSFRVGEVDVVSTPSRHASGRGLLDKDRTLWTSYAFVGPRHRVYFSGDTGMFPGFREIGARLGPFDLTMIESGAYNRAWPDWHLGPEQAVEAHGMLRGRTLLPIHWGLFDLAAHAWTEPVERVLIAAKAAGATVVVPRPGQSVEPEAPPSFQRWWPDLPWHTAAEAPIRATSNGQPLAVQGSAP
ncbi:MBL fold metallo-hydrolase [Geothrix sp. 21YS21S-4]|uniref:MBL fold metallo-hydrolase n=1 Tax=Geothrix sp. 21YS21S-4 TaxID=3068889 RepID=UPI0027BA9C25|nr:MBL fold metallo-hydrolase [Geothrix sp. 21YS21S-4]